VALRKMLPPNSCSLTTLASEEGYSEATFYNSRRQVRAQGHDPEAQDVHAQRYDEVALAAPQISLSPGGEGRGEGRTLRLKTNTRERISGIMKKHIKTNRY
jgi:hypothetical protein